MFARSRDAQVGIIVFIRTRGYRCSAGEGVAVNDLRKRRPDPQLASPTVSRVCERLAGFLKTLDERPFLISHSRVHAV